MEGGCQEGRVRRGVGAVDPKSELFLYKSSVFVDNLCPSLQDTFRSHGVRLLALLFFLFLYNSQHSLYVGGARCDLYVVLLPYSHSGVTRCANVTCFAFCFCNSFASQSPVDLISLAISAATLWNFARKWSRGHVLRFERVVSTLAISLLSLFLELLDGDPWRCRCGGDPSLIM